MAPKVSISTAAVQPSSQCAVGYSGIMCATCADGYYKASSGTCRQCTDPKDPAVAQTTHMLAMLPIIVAVIALLFLCYLFSNAAEQRVVSHAQAAKRFQIYAGQSRARVLLLATKASIQRRVRSMIRAAAKRARFGRQDHPYLFQIEPSDVEIPSWRPEKFKIMLGFFQVIGSFKEVYEIPWPDTMSRLMDICSLADFNFVDATAAECVPLLFWVIIYMKRTRGVRDTLLLIQDPSQESLKQRLLLKMRLDIINHGQVVDEEKIQLFETEMLGRFLCDRNLNEPSTVAQVGFIYHSCRCRPARTGDFCIADPDVVLFITDCTRFWWFEVWDLGRKLLLNCIISLLAKAGANRVICGLVVLLVYLSVMLFYQPYREPSDSALAGLVHIQLFITLFFSILNEKRNAIKFAQRQNREDHRRAITAHVRKLWRKALGYALTEIYLDNPDAGPMPLLVMAELARRRRYQQELDDLNAQLELTSAVKPSLAAHDQQDSLSASQINVLEDGNDAPDEHMDDRFEKNPDLTNNKKQM
ncbi:hypothetical protein AM588_10007071 [Phytophthora nicotianae]|uniref:Uncharacterized protein n=1 Tax=Phytophthora nicotianae TaxID=4792 RepID=A0A0W8DNL6_PHYNI|nr:hypothetical protein AM588_10007071 [Phytophthora nicotianae]